MLSAPIPPYLPKNTNAETMKVAEWFRERDASLADARAGNKAQRDAAAEEASLATATPLVPRNSKPKQPSSSGEDDAVVDKDAVVTTMESQGSEKGASGTCASGALGTGDDEGAEDTGASDADKETSAGGDSINVDAHGGNTSAVTTANGDGAGKGVEDGKQRDEEGGEAGGEPVNALRLSEEEVAKLKEEQEARCRELAMNVNVFMPYKVSVVVGICDFTVRSDSS